MYLMLSSFFWICFSSCCSGWMLISSLCSKSLIWVLASSPPLLVPCRFFFISLSVTSFLPGSFFIFFCHTQWVLWASLPPMFWTLHLIDWLSMFSIVLFLGFCSVLSLGPYFFAFSICQPPCVCFCVLHRSALTLCLSSMACCRKDTCKLCAAES